MFKYLHNIWTFVIIVVAHHYWKQNSQNQSAHWRRSIATNLQPKKTYPMRKSPYLSQVYFSIFHSLSHTNYYMFLKKIDVVNKHLHQTSLDELQLVSFANDCWEWEVGGYGRSSPILMKLDLGFGDNFMKKINTMGKAF